MAIATIKAGSRFYGVTPATQNVVGAPFLELGPAGTERFVSAMVVQFNPTDLWVGSFTVVGRAMGTAAQTVDMPFVPIPYKRVTLVNAAQDYAMVTAAITSQALILIPANGMSIALQFDAQAGRMDIASWDLQGSSAV